MSGRRIGQKVFDWVALSSKLPEKNKPDFSAFRARYEGCKTSMLAYPEKPEAIDWDYYKSNIAKPGLVQDFQKQFQAITIPYPKNTKSAMLQQERKKVEADVEKTMQEVTARMAELQAELDVINAEKPLDEMTIDEYLETRPEIKKEADDDTKNHRWHLGWH